MKSVRKIILSLIAIILICTLVSCDYSDGTQGSANASGNTKDSEIQAAKKAYGSLSEAHELIVEMMDAISNAWHFAIYDADDYNTFDLCVVMLAINSGLFSTELKEATDVVLNKMGYSQPSDTKRLAALRTFSTTIAIVKQVFTDNGKYEKIDELLSAAKTSIKSITGKYEEYTGYSTLKSYYSETSAYAEFCKDPTGSYQQLSTTRDNYETKLRNYKNELSFVLDE
ncbi:MAG: hypothetical protein ACI3XE_02625 [Eubacteriales bacterium]